MENKTFSNGMSAVEMKHYLDHLVEKYNNPSFVVKDPVSVPHMFRERNDIEVSAFLASTIAWGRRDLIIRSALRLMEIMGNEPYSYVISASERELSDLKHFVHRTFNGNDAITFVLSLRHIYLSFGSVENVVAEGMHRDGSVKDGLRHLHDVFFAVPHNVTTERHLPDVSRGSAAKKINMFLRWMVRSDNKGVDFGLWSSVEPRDLYIPLDLHAGNSARRLGLMNRKQNDWKAVEELTAVLKEFDINDPARYDFALFGAGINGLNDV